jgi:O-antigen/teichoic acid export membrane protein
MLRRKATRLIGSTVVSQALLSGTNFVVAFLLLRRLGTEPYGYYVLIATGILLFTILQGAFFQTRIVATLSAQSGSDLPTVVGGLIGTRKKAVAALVMVSVLACLLMAMTGLLPMPVAMLFIAGTVSGVAVLWREFSRGLLLAHHQGGMVVKGDVVYVLLLLACSYCATFLPNPSLMAVCSIGVAGALSAVLLSHDLWNFMAWSKNTRATAFSELSSIGGWAALGAGVHWSFSQGYIFIVAAMLDVNTVAAIAATRLLLMPVNLLSTGVNQALYPLVARWNAQGGLAFAAKKTVGISVAIVLVCLAYIGLAWLLQDWFFLKLMRHDVILRAPLVFYWSVLAIVMLLRDELGCLLVVKMKVKALGYITSLSAAASLLSIYLLIPPFGAQGALWGVIIGELINIAGMLALFFIELRLEQNTAADAV